MKHTRFPVAGSLSLLICVFATSLDAVAQPKAPAVPEFEARTFADPDDAKRTLLYRFLKPSKIEKDKRYPLLLCLHSLGLVGDDNKKQLNDFQDLFAGLQRGPYQCFVLVPQASTGQDKKWNTYGPYGDGLMKKDPTSTMTLVKALVDESLTKYPVDPQRIYVTGPSLGGYGTWEFVQRWPEMEAAAAPAM